MKTFSDLFQVKLVLEEDRRTGEDRAVLLIPSAVRGDTGKYAIHAKNEHGEDTGDFRVVVLGWF